MPLSIYQRLRHLAKHGETFHVRFCHWRQNFHWCVCHLSGCHLHHCATSLFLFSQLEESRGKWTTFSLLLSRVRCNLKQQRWVVNVLVQPPVLPCLKHFLWCFLLFLVLPSLQSNGCYLGCEVCFLYSSCTGGLWNEMEKKYLPSHAAPCLFRQVHIYSVPTV